MLSALRALTGQAKAELMAEMQSSICGISTRTSISSRTANTLMGRFGVGAGLRLHRMEMSGDINQPVILDKRGAVPSNASSSAMGPAYCCCVELLKPYPRFNVRAARRTTSV